jgi:hypothetical protein
MQQKETDLFTNNSWKGHHLINEIDIMIQGERAAY